MLAEEAHVGNLDRVKVTGALTMPFASACSIYP